MKRGNLGGGTTNGMIGRRGTNTNGRSSTFYKDRTPKMAIFQ